MKKIYRRYLYILILTQVFVCFFTTFSVGFMTSNIGKYTEESIHLNTMNTVEERLRERVENTIVHLEHQNVVVEESARDLIHFISEDLSGIESNRIYSEIQRWMKLLKDVKEGGLINVLFCDGESQKYTYFTINGEDKTNFSYEQEDVVSFVKSCPIYEIIPIGNSIVYIYTEQENIDKCVQSFIYDKIHATIYGEDGYVWVNQVIDYSGGDQYAIRVIHPNLKDTEGLYLSTDTTDVKGNLPYLAELEAIKEEGEIFHTYYFKNLSNDEIAEKASFAKLYEPYDWIIATGEPLDTAMEYEETLLEHNRSLMTRTIMSFILIFLLIFIADVVIIFFLNKNLKENMESYVKTETKQDSLTGAFSRKAAERILSDVLKSKDSENRSDFLMIFDIDDFKNINDTYGHGMGDLVLQRISEEIQSNIRESDALFRWGGDEFVILCRNLESSDHFNVGKKILRSVNGIFFEGNGVIFHVSISIGSSWVKPEDQDYMQVIKRADKAMYYSKKVGKGRYSNFEELIESGIELS